MNTIDLELIEEVMDSMEAEYVRLDGLDEAIIGYTDHGNTEPALVYSVDKIVQILMERDEMSELDAKEFFSYNIDTRYSTKGNPVFVWTD
jgi:hypothetical protein